VIISKITEKALLLSKKLRHVINFVNPDTIEQLKNKVVAMDEAVGSYKYNILDTFINEALRSSNIKQVINDAESIVSDMDSIESDESENASQFDLWDPNAWFDDTELGFLDNLAGAIGDVLGPGDDESSVDDFETARSSRSSRSSFRPTIRYPKQTIRKGRASAGRYKVLATIFQSTMTELFNVLIESIDSYNQARVNTEEALSERKEMIKREYIGSGKTYSVGNKYAEQLYNSQGLYK
jgi:hypothetical protein